MNVVLSRQQRLLIELLQASGASGAHMRECNAVGYLYGARFCELRKKGYVIRCVRLDRGEFKYVLDAEPPVEPVRLEVQPRERPPELFNTRRVGDSVFYKPRRV